MTRTGATIPAVSHELQFISYHAVEADEILQGDIAVVPPLRELLQRVYDRANEDACKLLEDSLTSLQAGVRRLVRLEMTKPRGNPWEIYGALFAGARGRKRRIGGFGFHVGYGQEGFRLIGYLIPRRGGLDGRLQLVHACKKKLPKMKVHLAADDSKRYPDWNNCVVWFSKDLHRKVSHQNLQREIATASRRFFKVASPLLKKLSAE
jgi:hypothetical protein